MYEHNQSNQNAQDNNPTMSGLVGSNPVKESQIQREFSLLGGDIERLLARISTVRQKIEPILRTDAPDIGKADKELSPGVGVAQEIYQNRLKILDGCSQLENMIGRIEL